MPPTMLLHIAYHCLMRLTIGGHIYTLSTHITEIPDFTVLYTLGVAFTPGCLSYLLDIGHFELQETQRVLNKVGKRYSPQVIKALLQQGVSVPVKPTGHGRVALLISCPGWWFVSSLYHFSPSPAQSNLAQPVVQSSPADWTEVGLGLV